MSKKRQTDKKPAESSAPTYFIPPAVAALPCRELPGGVVQINNKDFAKLMGTDTQGLRRWRSRDNRYQIPEPMQEGNVSWFDRADVVNSYLLKYPSAHPSFRSGASLPAYPVLVMPDTIDTAGIVASLIRQNELLVRLLNRAHREIQAIRRSQSPA